MNLSAVVRRRANTTLAGTRRGAPTLEDNGRWTDGSASSLRITGVVYPSTSRDALLLPEGRRNERRVCFITEVELRAPTAGGSDGDLFTYQNESYEVLHVEPWAEQGFWRSVLVKATQ